MSYDAYEHSVDDGAPIEIYSFTSEVYSFYLTDSSETISAFGKSFLPIQIDRDPIGISGVIVSPSEMNIRIPRDSDFGDKYGKAFSPPDLKVRIWRKHHGDTDWKRIFVGMTINFNPKHDNVFEISSVPFIQWLLNRQMSANRWGAKCNHDLYDNRCGLVKADFTWTTTVTAIDETRGQFITVANDHNNDGQLVLGDMIINGEYRLILNNVANVIKIRYPYTELEIGMEVTLIKGCKKTRRWCIDEFDNFPQFGGFPLDPNKNIAKPAPDVPFVNVIQQVF